MTSAEYWRPEEIAQRMERHVEDIIEQLATGQLPSVQLPWNGPVIPACAVPPFTRLSENGE